MPTALLTGHCMIAVCDRNQSKCQLTIIGTTVADVLYNCQTVLGEWFGSKTGTTI
ncbi:MAG: hypothetical protein V7K97_00125 [Nostoc sp.]|uniref:hypothetical protein n=1 Tax=Nostoc sp. TaxID=1180 RepID=UPI002FFC5D75